MIANYLFPIISHPSRKGYLASNDLSSLLITSSSKATLQPGRLRVIPVKSVFTETALKLRNHSQAYLLPAIRSRLDSAFISADLPILEAISLELWGRLITEKNPGRSIHLARGTALPSENSGNSRLDSNDPNENDESEEFEQDEEGEDLEEQSDEEPDEDEDEFDDDEINTNGNGGEPNGDEEPDEGDYEEEIEEEDDGNGDLEEDDDDEEDFDLDEEDDYDDFDDDDDDDED